MLVACGCGFFFSVNAFKNFTSNAGIWNIFCKFRSIAKNFVVSYRVVWLEILGLLMCDCNLFVFKKVASMWGSILFSDDYESNGMSVLKVCVWIGFIYFIQESLCVVIEGKEYQVYVKKMIHWEPDVADEGSFMEDDNNSIGLFEGGNEDLFDNNAENGEDDNIYQCEEETEAVSEKDRLVLGRKHFVSVNKVQEYVDDNHIECEDEGNGINSHHLHVQ